MEFELNRFRSRRGKPTELLALDFGTTALKTVRLRNGKDGYTLVSVEIFPPVNLMEGGYARRPTLQLPKQMKTNYAVTAASNPETVAKLMSLTNQAGSDEVAAQVGEQFGIGQDFRIKSVVINTGKKRTSRMFLAAAVPEIMIKNLLAATSSGRPAPRSFEISALAALTAYLESPGGSNDDAVCFIEIGAQSTYIFFIQKGGLLLLRKYDIGSGKLIESIINDFHVDRNTAINIMSEGAIDLSALYADAFGTLVRQTAISRDFVERQKNCSISKIVLSGGIATSKDWIGILKADLGLEIEVMNPFAGLKLSSANSLDPNIESQSPRFTAAIGAAIGGFSKT